MDRELIIDESHRFVRAAIVEEGKLCEIHTEKLGSDDLTECFFLGRIQSVRPSLSAAFIDIGTEKNAFLPIADGSKLQCGSLIIVQGQAKQASETKGLRVTSKVNLAGRWCVLIPNENGVHISKKVKDPALREELLEIGGMLCPAGFGLIIRTASEDVTEALLQEEIAHLASIWNEIQIKAAGSTKPGLLYARLPLHLRLIRDVGELSRIVINTDGGCKQLLALQKEQKISQNTQIAYHDETTQLIFDAFGVEPQIDKALQRRVWLPCGGYLIIDFCEAMTVIDVNSGKMLLGKNIEETALRVNLQAADEIARQLRLRDIGGMILIDFIDMRSVENQQTLVRRMREAVSRDRTHVSVEGLTRLGLLEMTRKRVHTQLHKALLCGCTYCSSTGALYTPEETARRALRQMRRMILAGQRGPFLIRCAAASAQAILDVPVHHEAEAYVLAVSGRHAERFDIEQLGAGICIPAGAQALQHEE